MRKIKRLLFVVLTLVFSSVYAFEKDVFSEPSLIFPEIFLIESAHTFSYTLADDFYKESDALFNYLNSVDFSQEQFHVRYIYYLRTRQFMPALTLMMTMVSLNIWPSSFANPYDEFFNLLQMAANDINEHSSGSDTFSFEDPDISGENERYVRSLLANDDSEPLTIEDLSGKLTAELVLNFAAVNLRNKRLGRENRITPKTVFFILASSFKTILSGIEKGVNLDSDPFFKELFNRFVAMHKDEKEILSSFVYNFVEKIYGSDTETGLYRYILLRQFGMIENAAENWLSFKDVKLAAEWISFVKKQNDIKPFSSFWVKNEDACAYIAEKTDWVLGMKHLSNESKKETVHSLKLAGMMEQCGDLDYIGLVEKSTENEDKPDPEWARYAAYALKTVTEGNLSEDEAVKVLKKGLVAAIFSIKPETEADKDMYEIMLFIYRHRNCDEVLKAMFLKQISHGDIDKNADSYQKAAGILDDFLFY
jgi:hypothetical protein